MTSRERPLSPHLQVYRWQIQMVTSILNRATGIALSVGTLFVAAGLVMLAAGPDAWAAFRSFAAGWAGQVLLLGWTWSLAFHLLGSIRHLVQDAGYGFGIPDFVRFGWVTVVGSFVLTALVWFLALRGGAA